MKDETPVIPRVRKVRPPRVWLHELQALNQIMDEGGCATATAAIVTLKTLGDLLAKGLVRPVAAWELTPLGRETLSAIMNKKLRRKPC